MGNLTSQIGTCRILDLVHLVLICDGMYFFLVSSWGGIAREALVGQIHTLLSHLLFVSAATILCQGFFLHRWVELHCVYLISTKSSLADRVYIFSRKNWMLTGVL